MESVNLDEQYPTRTSPQPGLEGTVMPGATGTPGSVKRPLESLAVVNNGGSGGEPSRKRRQMSKSSRSGKADSMAEADDETTEAEEAENSDTDTNSQEDMDTIRVDHSDDDPDNGSPGGSQEVDRDDYLTPKSMHEEDKYAPYRDSSYQHVFEEANIVTTDTADRFSKENTDLCHKLLGKSEQPLPQTSSFDNAIVEACKSVKGRRDRETLLYDLNPLFIPAPDDVLNSEEHNPFCESVNEKWSSSPYITNSPPQPDLAVGFGPEAFKTPIHEAGKLLKYLLQQQKQQPPRFNQCVSPFQGAPSMFFPFFSCEVGDVDLARPHNTHCMFIGMDSIVKLFRTISRLSELNGEILAFSIWHNDCMVKISAHYAVIVKEEAYYHEHVIFPRDSQEPDPKEDGSVKPSIGSFWIAHDFVINLYRRWAPTLRDPIDSGLEDLLKIAPKE
ncbi:hypothetical protein GGI42DRAFT_366582 [Trichoderma sp. SZMC 28013]